MTSYPREFGKRGHFQLRKRVKMASYPREFGKRGHFQLTKGSKTVNSCLISDFFPQKGSKTVKKGQKHEKTAKNDEKQRFSLFLLKKGTPSEFFVKYGRGFPKTCQKSRKVKNDGKSLNLLHRPPFFIEKRRYLPSVSGIYGVVCVKNARTATTGGFFLGFFQVFSGNSQIQLANFQVEKSQISIGHFGFLQSFQALSIFSSIQGENIKKRPTQPIRKSPVQGRKNVKKGVQKLYLQGQVHFPVNPQVKHDPKWFFS